MKATALIVAAGRSLRFGGALPKQYQEISGRPLLAWTISRFERADTVDRVVVAVAPGQVDYVRDRVILPHRFAKVIGLIEGGDTRQQSVLNGLESLPKSTRLVAIHDGARPTVLADDIDRVVRVAAEHRAAMLGRPVTDTVKRARDGFVLGTIDRLGLYLAQTPQVFDYDLIIENHRRAAVEGKSVTDDAALFEASGFQVRLVESQNSNLKVTTKEDLALAAVLLEQEEDESE